MTQGINPYISYRIVDPVTGAVLVPILKHPHKSRWTMRGFQPGSQSGSSVGDFEIPLFGTNTKEYADAYSDYINLKFNARIEGYLNLGDITEEQTGDPIVTGVISEIEWGPNTSFLRGFDAVYRASQAKTLKTEFVSTTSRPGQPGSTSKSDNLIIAEGGLDSGSVSILADYSLTYGDDFTGATPLTAYTNDGSWVIGTDEGLSVAQMVGGTGAGDGLLRTNTSFPQANYVDGIVDGVFHLSLTNPGNNTAGVIVAEAAVIAAATDANNLILGRALVRYNGKSAPRRYEISAEIWKKVAGVYTALVTKPQVLTLNASLSDLRLQVALVCKVQQTTASLYQVTWKLLINGTDSGCFTVQTVSSLSGAIGLRNHTAASFSTTSASQLVFLSRGAIFQTGQVPVGVFSINQPFSRASMLDLWNFISVLEGWVWRKNPKAGLNNDTVDFGPTPPPVPQTKLGTGSVETSTGGIGTSASSPLDFTVLAGPPIGWLMFVTTTCTGSVTSVTDASDSGAFTKISSIRTDDGFEVALWYRVIQVSTPAAVQHHFTVVFTGSITGGVFGVFTNVGLNSPLNIVEARTASGIGTSVSMQINNGLYPPPAPYGNLAFMVVGGAAGVGIITAGSGDFSGATNGGGSLGFAQAASSGTIWNVNDAGIGLRTLGASWASSVHWGAVLVILGPYPVAVGQDFSTAYVFEEDKNITDWGLSTNAEYFATDIELASSPTSDNSGTISWKNLTAIRLYGFLSEIVQATGLGDLLSLRKHAQQISIRTGAPGQAKTIKVAIEPDTAFKFREMDYIGLLIRSQQIFNLRVLVLGYSFTEGVPEMDLILDQFTFDVGYRNLRNRRNLEAIEAQTSGRPGMTTGTFYNPIDSSQGSPVVFSPNATTPTAVTTGTLKFFIPSNLQVLQKIYFAISAFGANAGVSTFTVDGVAFTVSDITGGPWSGINDSQEIDITDALVSAGFTNGGWHSIVATTANAVQMQMQAHIIGVVKGT